MRWFVGGFCGYGKVCVGDWGVGRESLDNRCHQLSENIWFV